MTTTLRRLRDRTGHALPAVLAVFVLLAAGAPAAEAKPGDYKAQRFDVVARAVDGALDVTETITFEFQSGTFTKVWREIPSSRTDGIQIVGAAMDGTPITRGDGPGHFAVSGDNSVRVEWRFAEVGPSVHRFDLHYVARGVVYRDGTEDVLRWRALPSEHRYRIDASRISFEPAGGHARPPEAHRVSAAGIHESNEGVAIDASGIASNGWIIADLRYPAGTLIASDPQWRQQDSQARRLAPTWGLAAAAIFVMAMIVVLTARRGYSSPADVPGETTVNQPPAPLPAALAAALAAKGRTSGLQPMGTILDLADRGVLTVRESARSFGVRSYELAQVAGNHDLEPHEIEALTIAFGGHGDEVSLSKARGRLTRQGRRFVTALNGDLASLGLIDPDRKAARDRLFAVSLFMIPAAMLGMVATAALIPRYDGWPFVMPAALLLAGLIGIVMAAAATPLSDEGLVEAARWRGFKRYLRTLVSSNSERDPASVPSRWLVYAIALGLGYHWGRYLKRHPRAAPAWFVTANADGDQAFAAFMGSHAASAGGGAGGGGAAGGGGSGAG